MNYKTRKTVIVDGERITASAGFLNTLSLWAIEAADRYNERGSFALGREAKETSREIYEQLEKMGLYKK